MFEPDAAAATLTPAEDPIDVALRIDVGQSFIVGGCRYTRRAGEPIRHGVGTISDRVILPALNWADNETVVIVYRNSSLHLLGVG